MEEAQMPELADLTKQRDVLLQKLRAIEENCEGIENEHNACRVQELNVEQSQLLTKKSKLQEELEGICRRLAAISDEIDQLSGTGMDRILDAIKQQRWYFFKNKTKVVMDKNTGFLWVNLKYYTCLDKNENDINYNYAHTLLPKMDLDGFKHWRLPGSSELRYILETKEAFPFLTGTYKQIASNRPLTSLLCSDMKAMWLDSDYPRQCSTDSAPLLPCYDGMVNGSDYANNVSPKHPIYSERERLQFTLNLFVKHGLWPVFNDADVTQLYKKIYFEKPACECQ